MIALVLDVIVVALLYRVAGASDPAAELAWIGLVLGVVTAAVVVVACIMLAAFALGYWLLSDGQRPAGGLRVLPASRRIVYGASFLAAILSAIVIGSVDARLARTLLQSIVNAS